MSSSGARGRRRSRALALSLAALGCAGARPLPSGESGEEPGLGAVASAEVPSAPKPELPNVPLTTHEGRSVRFYDDLVRGRVVLIYFMFTSCRGICPGTTANVRRVQEALGDRVGRDVFFYAITLDPEVDTPEVLRGYAEAVGAGRGWLFLTGGRGDVDRLRRRLGVVDRDPVIDADKTQHMGIVLVGNDAKGRWCAMPGLVKPRLIADALRRVAG